MWYWLNREILRILATSLTCALTRTTLHLVKPLGFSIEDRYLKRAGLDYWDQVQVRVWDSFQELYNNIKTIIFIWLLPGISMLC